MKYGVNILVKRIQHFQCYSEDTNLFLDPILFMLAFKHKNRYIQMQQELNSTCPTFCLFCT